MTALLAPDREPVLSAVAPDADDAELTIDQLGSRIVGMAGRIAAATSRWLLLVADFDRREGFAGFGLPTTARWLSFACGVSHRTAVEHVRVARALNVFPVLSRALASGSLSYSHARAISRLATPDEPGLVADLVELARHATITQLEDTVRGLRTAADNSVTGAAGDDPPQQYLSHGWTSSSQWRCQARLDPEKGAFVQGVLETIARRDDIPLADALVRMAEVALAAVNDSANPPRPLRGDERAAIVIHVEAAAIPLAAPGYLPPDAPVDLPDAPDDVGGEVPAGPGYTANDAPRSIERAGPVGRIADGPGLPAQVAMRLLCGGRVRTAIHDQQGNVCDLGRSRRVVSVRLFRALLMLDGGCAHPGCHSRAGLEAHHIRHWLHGGRTDLRNLVLLCCRHHHAHHDGEFTIGGVPGRSLRFWRIDGRELEARIDPARLRDSPEPIEREHRTVRDDAARGQWSGQRLDRHYVVSVLADRRGLPPA